MASVILQPLTRVEGHGRVELILQDGILQQVRVALIESPRLFEKMVTGRTAGEVPELVCRICAICSAVHKLAALTALERALAIDVPPAARLVRELLLLGGHLQSHALHLFCLILPDFSGRDSVLELLRDNDPLARAGIELKSFGNRLQEIAGGRVLHPVNAVLGGVAGRPAPAELDRLQHECDRWLTRWPVVAANFRGAAHYPAAATIIGTPLAAGAAGEFTLEGEWLSLPGGESVAAGEYLALLDEQPVGYSRARRAAGKRGPFVVGALARQQLWRERSDGACKLAASEGIHANNAAQLMEIDWALGRISRILGALREPAGAEPLAAAPGPVRAGIGTAAFEAPRGLLIHRYVVDDRGVVAAADIVTPTAVNQLVMERQLLADLAGIDDEAILRSRAERIVRAYDPCISCAVHLLQR